MAKKDKKQAVATLADELVEDIKIESDIPVSEFIRYPLIWERTTSGYRVQDLQPTTFEEALYLIKEYYIYEETLCKRIELASDKKAVEEYLGLVRNWLKDIQSLAAVEEGTGSLVGILIGRVLDKTVRTQSRVTVFESERLSKMHKIQANLMKKIDILNIYGVHMFYNIYVLLVTPQHRGKGVGKALVRSVMDLSKKMKSKVVGGLFTSKIAQNLAHKEGFKVHDEIFLNDWKENGKGIHKENEIEANSVTFMAVKLKEETPLAPTPPTATDAPRRKFKPSPKTQKHN